MVRSLLVAAFTLLTLAPVGVAAGLWWWLAPGLGIAVGSVLYGALGVWLLTADILPDPNRGASQ